MLSRPVYALPTEYLNMGDFVVKPTLYEVSVCRRIHRKKKDRFISASRREKANAIAIAMWAMWPIVTWVLLVFSCCLFHYCSCLCDPDKRPCRRANATVQIASEEDVSSDSGPSDQTDIILPSTTRVHQTSAV